MEAAQSDDRYARTCFVIMPYSVRDVGNRRVDFDRIYEDIFKPAIKRVRVNGKVMMPVRADEGAESRILIHTMIRDLLQSRLALAEVSTDNRNVYWELGVRHYAVRSGTVLLRLKATTIPFDIAPVMVTQYSHTPAAAAELSIGVIAAALRATLQKNEVDSPAYIAAREVAISMGPPESPTKFGAVLTEAEGAALKGAPLEAATLYAEAMALTRESPLLLQRQGTLFAESGNRDLAQHAFRKVLELDPRNGDARRMLTDVNQNVTPPLIALDPLDSRLFKHLVTTEQGVDLKRVIAAAGTAAGLDISISPASASGANTIRLFTSSADPNTT